MSDPRKAEELAIIRALGTEPVYPDLAGMHTGRTYPGLDTDDGEAK